MSTSQQQNDTSDPNGEAGNDTQKTLDMVILMGVTGSGKSHFVNTAAGRDTVKEGHDLNSCTHDVAGVDVSIGASKVFLIDTPGFDDPERTDAQILDAISQLLALWYAGGYKLKGCIYLHRITDNKFPAHAIKTLKIFQHICGDSALKNVLLVTTRWDEIEEKEGAKRESQLRSEQWKYMLAKGSTLARFKNTPASAHTLLSELMGKGSVVLDLQRELVDERKRLCETAAGNIVYENVQAIKDDHQQLLEELKKERDSLQSQNDTYRRELMRDQDKQLEMLQKVYSDQARLERRPAEEVQKKVKSKRGASVGKVLLKVLPLVPATLEIIGMFVGFPPGVMHSMTSWMKDFGQDGPDDSDDGDAT